MGGTSNARREKTRALAERLWAARELGLASLVERVERRGAGVVVVAAETLAELKASPAWLEVLAWLAERGARVEVAGRLSPHSHTPGS